MNETRNLTVLPSEREMADEQHVIPTMEEMAENIKETCEKNNMQYHETIGRIYIKSPSLANWYIDIETFPPQLYHENYRKVRSTKGSDGHFHRHDNVSGYSAEDLVKYIKVHDKKMLYKL